MKKSVFLILAALFLFTMSACGEAAKGPSGAYDLHFIDDDGSETNFTEFGMAYLVFDKKEVRFIDSDGPTSGKYTMNGTSIEIEYEDGSKDSYEYNADEDSLYITGSKGTVESVVWRHRDS